jgi:hypothetical protein
MTDRIRAFQETRRVMKQGGRFVFSVLGPLQYNPVAACVQDALNAALPADPPHFLARRLHGYADHDTIDANLTTAGFTDAVYTTVELPFTAPSAGDVALAYCCGTPLRSELADRTHGDTVVQAVTLALTNRFGDGAIRSTMRAHIVSAAG